MIEFFRYLRNTVDFDIRLAPWTTNASTASPIFFPIDYRVLVQLIIPLAGKIGLPPLPLDKAVLDLISDRSENHAPQRQAFDLFFDKRKVKFEAELPPESSYFIRTDGIGLSWSLKECILWLSQLGDWPDLPWDGQPSKGFSKLAGISTRCSSSQPGCTWYYPPWNMREL